MYFEIDLDYTVISYIYFWLKLRNLCPLRQIDITINLCL